MIKQLLVNLNNFFNTEKEQEAIFELSVKAQEEMEEINYHQRLCIHNPHISPQLLFPLSKQKAVPIPHERACKNCLYYSGQFELKCAVNPTCPSLLNSFRETVCLDFTPRI
jgi:hypothetical protein